jgi:glycosyltransferase involved in cell wall biosynthesis
MQPLVSIIIPVYNSERTIERCIASVCDQSFPDWEIIVVDSDSSDDTEKLVKEWCNRLGDKCQYYKIRNRFQAAKRNFGARMAKGTYLFLLDSDEYMSRNVLQSCLKHVQEGYDACSIRIEYNWASGYLAVSRYHIRNCCYDTPVGMGSPLFILKAKYWRLDGQDERLNYVEDADFAYKFCSAGGKMVHVTDAYLLHDENVSLRWIVYKPLFTAPRERDLIARWKGIAELTPRKRVGNYLHMVQFLLKQPRFIFGFAFLLVTRFITRRISRATDNG